MTKNQIKGIMSNKSDNWRTPLQIRNRLIYEFDPCPYKHDINEWDGLKISWDKSYCVFCNPPYSQIKKWVEKILLELKGNFKIIKLLVPSRTDTKWFHNLMNSGYIYKIIFFEGRLHFNEKQGAPFPSILIYLTNDLRFKTENIKTFSFKSNGNEIL